MNHHLKTARQFWLIFFCVRNYPVHFRTKENFWKIHRKIRKFLWFYTAANAAQRAGQSPATTLRSLFTTCANDPFARTLFYSEMPRTLFHMERIVKKFSTSKIRKAYS